MSEGAAAGGVERRSDGANRYGDGAAPVKPNGARTGDRVNGPQRPNDANQRALHALTSAGAIIFPCNPKTKAARGLPTQKALGNPPGYWVSDAIRAACRMPRGEEIPGIVPGRIKAIVFDGDTDTPDDRQSALALLAEHLGDPWLVVATSKRHRFHAWYRIDGTPLAYKQPAWRYGETRCARGYVCLHRDAPAMLARHLDKRLDRVVTVEQVGAFVEGPGATSDKKRAGHGAHSHAGKGNGDLLDKLAAELAVAGEGERNSMLNKKAFNAARYGCDEAAVEAALRAACGTNGLITDDGEAQFEKTFASGWRAGCAVRADGPPRRAVADSWRPLDAFERTLYGGLFAGNGWESNGNGVFRGPQEQGAPLVLWRGLDDWRSLAAAFEVLGFQARRNVRAGGVVEWRVNGRGAWCPSGDGLERTEWMRAIVSRSCKVPVKGRNGFELRRAKYTQDAARVAWNGLTEERKEQYAWDPFLAWLRTLPKWDGVVRLDRLLIAHFGAADTPLARWASRATLMAAVARALHPGLKIDECPTLIGTQGQGKSTLYRASFPDSGEWQGRRDEWFSDGLDFTVSRIKELQEALQGRVIVEAPDIAGADIRKLDRLKAFLTSVDDGSARKAYRRDPEVQKRRAAIYATSNSDRPLPNDETGNRRFVVVRLTRGCNVERLMDDWRDQLWAEASARVDSGERPNLPHELFADRDRDNESYRDQSETEANVVDSLDTTVMYSVREVADEGGYIPVVGGQDGEKDWSRLTRALQRSLERELRNAGWKRTRTGEKGRCWIHPNHPDFSHRKVH